MAQKQISPNATIYFKDQSIQSAYINFNRINDYSEINYRQKTESKPETIKPQKVDSIVSKDRKFIYSTRTIGDQNYFQQKLIGGYADLFHLKDETRDERYFVSHPVHGEQELSMKSKKASNSGKTYNQETKQYLGTLSLLLKDCQPEYLNNTKFNIRSISKTLKAYNECKNKLTYIAEEIEKKPEFRIAFMGGANFTTISTNNQSLTGDFGYQTGMDLGMELIFIPTFTKSHFQVALGINYSDKGGEAEYLRQRFDRAIIDYEMIAFDLSLRYSFLPSTSKLNPYIGVFANKSFFLKDQGERMLRVSDSDGNTDYLIDLGVSFPNSFPLTFSAEAGMNYKLTNKSGLTFNANIFQHNDGEAFFETKGYALQLGYYIAL
ncbi:hypothetical protein GCM10023115_40860 [Pontixanthobacter gangjinensis]|uniref:PorT family protein n=1 Tax=Christiangramia aestuarii TaxID=1028746 RepID=A0A7K1LRV1_9FLAO|nr:hypothetical protein [Christiangramia aestuarii]MUP43529.1 hypothetical protein [Christiangramia aestuarii]